NREENHDVNVIVASCRLVDQSRHGAVGISQGEIWGLGWVVGRDPVRDLCVVHALFPDYPEEKSDKIVNKKLPAVRIASSQTLREGDPVYAVAAPNSQELTASEGIVSGRRRHGSTDYIQTTTAISMGPSGAGLFD